MTKFSERYGYSPISKEFNREKFPKEVANAVHNRVNEYCLVFNDKYSAFNQYLWIDVLHERGKFKESHSFLNLLDSNEFQWFEKLNFIEEFLSFFENDIKNERNSLYSKERVAKFEQFCNELNLDFKKRNYAYMIVKCNIIEVTSKQEVEAIEEAMENENKGVRTHLHDALTFLSAAQETPNYRSSIHQSISAVEAWCRKVTKSETLGDALKKLEKSGVRINPVLREGYEKIYGYTNGKDGIRHALMDDSNPPTVDEAIYMLVACSAFINYLTKKKYRNG